MPALAQTESQLPDNSGPVYSMWYLAVWVLTQHTEIDAIDDYFAGLGAGADGAQVFEEAFGLGPDELYTTYSHYANSVTVPGNANSRLFPPGDVNDYPADISVISATGSVAAGEQATLIGLTASNVRCTLEFVASNGESLFTNRTRSDPLGNVFWLFNVFASTPDGPATAIASCGTNSVSVPIEVTS
jgi:hypothetical protein